MERCRCGSAKKSDCVADETSTMRIENISKPGHHHHHSTIADLPVEIDQLIFRELKFEELKTARLVCRDWNQEICRMMDKQIFTEIRGQDCPTPGGATIDGYIDLDRQGVSLNLPSLLQAIRFHFCLSNYHVGQFKQLVLKNRDIFARIEHLSYYSIWDGILFEEDEILRLFTFFLDLCAENLTHLDLSCANWSMLNGIGLLAGIRPNGFPELRSYKLPEGYYEDYLTGTKDKTEVQYLIMRDTQKMLQRCPKLVSLDYPDGMWDCEANVLLSRGPYDFHQIQKLELPLVSSLRELLPKFQREHLPKLKALVLRERLDDKENGEGEVETCEFLRCFASTLECLHLNLIDFTFSFTKCADTFPVMPAVSTLILGDPYGDNVKLGAKWLYKFPALTKLNCGKLDLLEVPRLNTIEPHPNLEEISCRLILRKGKEKTPKVLLAVKTNFPRFKSWHIFEKDAAIMTANPDTV